MSGLDISQDTSDPGVQRLSEVKFKEFDPRLKYETGFKYEIVFIVSRFDPALNLGCGFWGISNVV